MKELRTLVSGLVTIFLTLVAIVATIFALVFLVSLLFHGIPAVWNFGR